MLIIWGYRTRSKTTAFNEHCASCERVTTWNHTIYKRWFTMFWIPLFPYRTVGETTTCTVKHDRQQTYRTRPTTP